jgi:membrane-associated protease RseP (regulator of RpoE activity)
LGFLGVLFDMQMPDAAVVRDVTPGSPAEHAGLRPGDMIIALNGQQVSSYPDAIQLIRMMQPGDQLVIDYSRRVNDQTQALLASRPGDMVRTAAAPDPGYESQVAPVPGPVPVDPDQPAIYRDGGIDRDPRMIDRERGVRRPLLPRLRN